jgi:hypothetical protein
LNSFYKIDPEQNLILKKHIGNITVEDEIELLDNILNDPEHYEGMNAICDFTDAAMDWNLGDIDKFRLYVAKNKKRAGKSRWAVVFPKGKNTSTIRLLIALHNSLEKTIKTKLFNSHEEALAWVSKIIVKV